MIIYCNGDSFTSGHGLGDNVLPGYPGDQVTNPIFDPVCKRWTAASYTGSLRNDNHALIRTEELRHCWPTKLGLVSGHEVINSAQAGSSMNRIARTTITDLIRLRKQHDDIHAIISVSNRQRREIYDDGRWLCVNPGHDQVPAVGCRHLVVNDTTYSSLVCWYRDIIQINDHCHVNGIKLTWIDSLNVTLPEYSDNTAELPQLREYAGIKFAVLMNKLVFPGKKSYAADGHYSAEIHTQVATILNTLILQGKDAWKKF